MKTIWTTKSIYVDIETGEVLPKKTKLDEWNQIKVTKTYKHNQNEYNPKGTITRTVFVRRTTQIKLPL